MLSPATRLLGQRVSYERPGYGGSTRRPGLDVASADAEIGGGSEEWFRRRAGVGRAVEPEERTSGGNCDPAVVQHPLGAGRKAGIGFKNWPGARDLNPGASQSRTLRTLAQKWRK
jgi:hypothetical protein